jgi:hypothetical protein
MQFRTELLIPNSLFKIEHHHALFFIGSCFAENIAEKTKSLLFNTLINPHGILYNPKSIALALEDYCLNKQYTKDDLFFHENLWHSWNHHSRFSDVDINVCLNNINKEITTAHEFLKQTNYLFITLGSAFVYNYTEKNIYVGNCHKLPNKKFTKELLSIQTIINDLTLSIKTIKKLNSEIKIIFTISPVRYIRYGIIENNLSKARLIEAVHQLCNTIENCFYFPAYELVIDDLRDYRFFKEDLVHPNDFAINYVWEKLSNAYFSNQCLNIIKEIEEIIKSENHRPMNVNSESYLLFKKALAEKKNKLQMLYPYIKFNKVEF